MTQLVCSFLVERTSFLRNLANLELCVVLFVIGMLFCSRVGIAAVELKLQRRYEMFVQKV